MGNKKSRMGELNNTMIFQHLFALTVFIMGISSQEFENDCMTLDEIKALIPQELQFNADVEMEHFNVMDTNGDGLLCADEVNDKFQQSMIRRWSLLRMVAFHLKTSLR